LYSIKIGIKNAPKLFLSGKFPNRIVTDNSTWTYDADDGMIEVTLAKDETVHDSEKPWWGALLVGEPEIDLDLIEGSKYLDVSLLKKVKAEKMRKKQEEERQKAEQAAKEQAAQLGADEEDWREIKAWTSFSLNFFSKFCV